MSCDNVAYVVKNSPFWYMWETLSRYEDQSKAKFLNRYAEGLSLGWEYYEKYGFEVVKVRLNFEEFK